MADCVENLIQHLESAIRELKQLATTRFEGHVDIDRIEGLVIKIFDQLDIVAVIYD